MAIEVRIVERMDELEQVTDLEIAIWGMDARFAVPGNIMSAMLHNGGLINAAFDGDTMVGMAVAFPGFTPQGQHYLWSHMAGVLPAYQRQDIGFQLKCHQRAWALEAGYSEIRWTFDPLQRGNAHFNIGRLGAISRIYHVDLYGAMEDGINAGMPSDRLEAIWMLDDARVQPRMDTPMPLSSGLLPLLNADGHAPVLHLSNSASALTIAIPASLTALRQRDPALVLDWRLAVRAAFLSAFKSGRTLTGFYDTPDFGCYVLTDHAQPL